jgi:hypothetical protein
LDGVVTLRTVEPLEYRCYLLDRYGRIVWRFKFVVSNDDEAITTARTLFRPRADSACGFEVWQNDRYLHCENDAAVLDLWQEHAVRNSLARRLLGWLSRAIGRRSRYV